MVKIEIYKRYIVIVNIDKTKEYYNSLSLDMLCDCDYCKLYYAKVKQEFPDLAMWFERYGIDIEKPFEVMSLEPDEKGMLDYIGIQYIAFGSCSDNYECSVGNIRIRVTSSHPNTGIKKEHFILEVFPMTLSLNR